MPKNKGGRPRKELDLVKLEKMCNIWCTGEECAAILDMDYDTLNTRVKQETGLSFSEYYKKHSAHGKMSLRRSQFKTAVKDGNVSMQIWLGKQYLGQKEPERENNDLPANEKMAKAFMALIDKLPQ